MNYSKPPLFQPVGMSVPLSRGRSGTPSSTGETCENPTLAGHSLAMVYSPLQEFENLYEPEAGLCAGTVFRDLEKPFWGAGRA